MIHLVWTAAPVEGGLGEGPWAETFPLADTLHLVDGEAGRSAVYHAVKHALPPGTALLVAPLDQLPKFKGLAPGALAWLRGRHPGA